jgi:hypothetical protein
MAKIKNEYSTPLFNAFTDTIRLSPHSCGAKSFDL